MNKTEPRVSIGMPVCNGENFIREALDSFLAQTFKDFELIISDNASSDRTEEICREYAAKDSRISYYRNEHNLGAAPNFNRTFALARGEFFKWNAHDDLCDRTFLEKAVAIFDSDPEIILCYSQPKIINAQGEVMDESDELFDWVKEGKVSLNTYSVAPHERFRAIIGSHPNYPIFGIIRSRVLEMIGAQPLRSYSGADRGLLARLGLFGRFHEFPEELLSFRRHKSQSIHALLLHNSHYEYNLWFDTSNKGKIILPLCSLLLELIDGINKAPLSWRERLLCYVQLTKRPFRHLWHPMVEELKVAIKLIVKRFTNNGVNIHSKT